MRSPRRTLLVLAAVLSAALTAGAQSALAATPSSRGVVVIQTNLEYQGAAAAGTGMVIRPGGEVLTNNHVIRGATAIRVVVPSTRRSYTATVLGYDIAADIALLKLNGAPNLSTVTPGNSAKVRRGQVVTAIGNAGGTGTLVSASGTVTGIGRSIRVQDDQGGTVQLRGLIQTNAELRPGDSGGPLFDRSGRVIGVDAAASVDFAFDSGSSQGYAIPINRALALAKQIEAGRGSEVVHIGPTAFLGVSVRSGSFGLADTAGALVDDVVSGGPADHAGLASGDVITAIGGTGVSSPAAIVPLLQRAKPGDTISLTWSDALGNLTSANVQLGSGPPQ